MKAIFWLENTQKFKKYVSISIISAVFCAVHLVINKRTIFKFKNYVTYYGRQKNGPLNISILIPENCEYVTLNGKKKLAEIIKLRILS